jgi:E1A/CREB-binding protein
MLFLSEFPIHLVINILTKWSFSLSLSLLDSACCNKVDREYFTKILSCQGLLSNDCEVACNSFVQEGYFMYKLSLRTFSIIEDYFLEEIEITGHLFRLKFCLSNVLLWNITSRRKNDVEYVNLKVQQNRLLLLHHAYKCPNRGGQCPINPYCFGIKVVWAHILICKDPLCRVPLCSSTRAILHHYAYCQVPSCSICSPVRETMKQNYLRYNGHAKLMEFIENRAKKDQHVIMIF